MLMESQVKFRHPRNISAEKQSCSIVLHNWITWGKQQKNVKRSYLHLLGGGRNPSELGAPAQQVSSWDLGSSGDLCRTSCMEPFLLCFFKFPEQVSIYFTCLRECCNSVLLWSSRNVFSTPKLPPAFHQHEGEWIMTECSFLGELFL